MEVREDAIIAARPPAAGYLPSRTLQELLKLRPWLLHVKVKEGGFRQQHLGQQV